jgi:hypothetical protein
VAISAANSDGLITSGQLAPRTFGEASFDLSSVTGGDDCVAFGSAMLKSRSSDSFTSQLKDFIRPISIGSNNCGAIKVTKTYKHAATPLDTTQAGVTFTIGTTAKVTGDDGTVCFDGLALNQPVNVVETLPAGYSADQPVSQSVTPNNAADCDDDPFGGETVSFGNTPLTDVSITIDSLVVGGTKTDVDCDNGVDAVTGAGGDGTIVIANDVEPGTIICTIVVDP